MEGSLKGRDQLSRDQRQKRGMWIKLDAPEEKRMFDLGNSKD